jgi:hypothetical protein
MDFETAQDIIRCDRLIFGYGSVGWKGIQQAYYAELRKMEHV